MNKTTPTPSQQPPLCHTHNGITMTRTFHPIGHGAFYTERFMQGGKYKFTAVFDCGCFEARKKGMSYARYTNRINKAVDSAFSPWEEVDLLFISHFHADHINGIKHLTGRCDVKHIIVPQLTPNIVIEAYIFNYLQSSTGQGDNAANSGVNLWIRELYNHRGNDNTEDFPRVIEVMPATEIPEEQEGQERGGETPPPITLNWIQRVVFFLHEKPSATTHLKNLIDSCGGISHSILLAAILSRYSTYHHSKRRLSMATLISRNWIVFSKPRILRISKMCTRKPSTATTIHIQW